MENGNYSSDKGIIHSTVVRAGKRTYFFDVRKTKNGDHYLVLTESKKRTEQDGSVHFQKHKIYLYKEDFEKFSDGLEESLSKLEELNGGSGEYSSDVDFDDLPYKEAAE